MQMTGRRRAGLGAVEAIVLLLIVLAVGLLILMAIPRGRETARLAGCQRNLMQIGVALNLYANAIGRYPTVPAIDTLGASPLEALLSELGQPDLSAMVDPNSAPPRRSGLPSGPRVIQGFVCPADPEATSGRFPAPVSYRACTGTLPDGRDGTFPPGRVVRPEDVEEGDGLSYTAAFSERFVGSGKPGTAGPRDYAIVPGPIAPGGCPDAPDAAFRGDAGSSWLVADWRSTLYNHLRTPNAGPDCLAEDRRSAGLGASSGHPDRVHLLLLDGSVQSIKPGIDLEVWRKWARINDRAASKP